VNPWTNIPEVEERIHENELADGPSNPVAQHVYDGISQEAKHVRAVVGSWSGRDRACPGSCFHFRSVAYEVVRRLNREVAHLNRQTEQLNQRVQGAEQHVRVSIRELPKPPLPNRRCQAATFGPIKCPIR